MFDHLRPAHLWLQQCTSPGKTSNKTKNPFYIFFLSMQICIYLFCILVFVFTLLIIRLISIWWTGHITDAVPSIWMHRICIRHVCWITAIMEFTFLSAFLSPFGCYENVHIVAQIILLHRICIRHVCWTTADISDIVLYCYIIAQFFSYFRYIARI